MPVRPYLLMVQRSAILVHARANWLLAGLCLVVLSSAVAAQQYRTDPVDKEASRNKSVALNSVKNPANYATEREKVLNYFKGSHFPEMTRTEPESLAKLGTNRSDLFRKYLWVTQNETLQRDLTNVAFAEMKRIVTANPPYHPAVRYNAVLTIGMLDAQYAIDAGANRRPPKPLAEANKLLVLIVNLGAAGKAVPPPLIAGALVGLERHAQFRAGLSNEEVEAMAAAVLKIATAEKPAVDMDSDVYAWIRLQAASVLAQLGTVGPNNQVYDALLKLSSGSKSLDDRCTIAALLAKIKFEGATVDGKALAEQLLKLAHDVADAEAKRATEYQDERFGGGGFSAGPVRSMRGEFDFGRGGLGAGFASEDEDEDDFPRSHVLARLSDLRTALITLKPIVPAEAQAKFDAILAAVNPAIETTADKDTVGLNVAGAVRDMADAIKRIAAPAEVVAADEAADLEAPAEAAAEGTKAAPTEERPAEAAPPADAPPAEVPPAARAPAAEAAPVAAPENGQ